MKIVGIIPAHMASVRFPGKILFPFYGIPMIEHVRRRALYSETLSDVIVATCDEEIAKVITSYGGKVLITANTHRNGTTRVAEAVNKIDCTHVVLLQGDEPLILPRHIDTIIKAIEEDPFGDAWNATGILKDRAELDRHSFVKCIVSKSGRIIHCFRRSPATSSAETQLTFIRKILGIIAYRKAFLLNLVTLQPSLFEAAEFIEQMRIIENDYHLRAVSIEPSLPSVNEPSEVEIVIDYLENNVEQRDMYNRTISKRFK